MFGFSENWLSLSFLVGIGLFEVLLRGKEFYFSVLLFFRWEGDFVFGFM